MNVFNRFFLYMALLLSGLYRKMGVHIPHLKAILNTKLAMDDRRVSAMQQVSGKKSKKPISRATIRSMILSAIMGCLFLVTFLVGNNTVTQLTVYFLFYIFILASMLIADFTTVLIDVRDNLIILPKPVNDQTFLLSRLLHIVIHICKVVLPMTVPGIIAIGYKAGLVGWLTMIPLLIGATLLTVFFINAVYVLVLKLTTPEKFKNIISYFQIFFVLLIYGSYQLLPRLIPSHVIASFNIEQMPGNWLLPPYWLASGWQYVVNGDISSWRVVYLLLSIASPIVCIWAVIKFFGPSFNQKLSMISGSEGDASGTTITKQEKISFFSRYVNFMAGHFTKKGSERMSFLQTWKITGRSRDFKMKVYPSIGYLLIYFIIMMLSGRGITLNNISSHPELFLFMLYFTGYTMLMAIYQLIYSDKFKAAWIYYITPIDVPGKLLSGAVKSLFVKFFIPFASVVSIFCIGTIGPGIIPNILLGIANQVLANSFIAYLVLRHFPFSVEQNTSSKGGNFLAGIFSLVIPGALGTVHFFIYKYDIAVLILTALALIAAWLMMGAIHNKSWMKIKLKEYEG